MSLELHNAINEGDLELVKSLIENGANVNETDDFGDTPLNIACYLGYSEIAKLLLLKEADIHEKNKNGFTALHNACSDGNIEIISLLLAKGAKINAVSSVSGATPLHCACLGTPPDFERNIEAIKLLIEKGADVNARNNRQDIPLAIANRNIEIARLLIPYMLIKVLKQEKPHNIQKNKELSLFWDAQIEQISKYNGLIRELGKPLAKDIFNKIISEEKGLTLGRLAFQFFKPSVELNILETEKNISSFADLAKFSQCRIL